MSKLVIAAVAIPVLIAAGLILLVAKHTPTTRSQLTAVPAPPLVRNSTPSEQSTSAPNKAMPASFTTTTQTASSNPQCAEGEELMTIPTSTVFAPYQDDAEPFCFKSTIGPVFKSPDGRWTAAMESGTRPDGTPIYYHFVYKQFADEQIGISDLSNNVFIVLTNLATGEQKKISIASLVEQSAIVSVAPTMLSEAGFDMYSSIIKWSSDGKELWGGVYFYWSGMDTLAAPPALSYFKIDVRDWHAASFSDVGNAVNSAAEAALLNGHLKSGQRWSLQNRPTDAARDAMVLR